MYIYNSNKWSFLRSKSEKFLRWRREVVVITKAQLYSTKSQLRFCAGSNPARGVSDICNSENI